MIHLIYIYLIVNTFFVGMFWYDTFQKNDVPVTIPVAAESIILFFFGVPCIVLMWAKEYITSQTKKKK